MRREFSRYVVVGGTGFALDYLLLLVLSGLVGVHYLVAASISFVAGAILVYFLSVRWVFLVRKLENRRCEFIIFFSVGIAGLLLNALIMWCFTEMVGIHHLFSKFFSAALIFGFNFILRKSLLFSTPVGA